MGLDSEYGYPTSLARQYAPQDLVDFNRDIFAQFNSDYNWYMEQPNPTWGSIQTINGGFYNQSKSVSFDLEQVAMHEFLHGLGFISSWGPWLSTTLGPKAMLPSFVNTDSFGTTIGLLPPWIYTKTMSDGLHNVWLKSYSKLINSTFSDAIIKGGLQHFVNTTAHKVSQSIYQLFETRNGVLIWYPALDNKNLQPGILYTPSPFQGGSSISHLDNEYYKATNTLMGPFATSGIKLSDMRPSFPNSMDPVVLGILKAMGYCTLV